MERLLRAAGYEDALMSDEIDMHGLALVKARQPPPQTEAYDARRE